MDKKPFPSETQERFIVRLPDGMRDRIAEAAKANGRSMNAEIVGRIEKSFELTDPADLKYLLALLQTQLIEKDVQVQVERARAYRFANAILYVEQHGAMPVWNEPGATPLIPLAKETVATHSGAYAKGKAMLDEYSASIEKMKTLSAHQEKPAGSVPPTPRLSAKERLHAQIKARK